MKKLIIYFLIIFCSFSCKKSWLEIVPFGNKVAETTDDYDKLMNSPGYYAYNESGYTEAVLMSDEVAAEQEFFSNVGTFRESFFEWRDVIFPIPTQSSFVLRGHLASLYEINMIIKGVMESKGGTEKQKKSIRAEALATRAWTYIELVNNYCKPYSQSTAASDLGFPLITEPNINTTNFSRGTLQETYDFIINDLTEALADVPDRSSVVTRMSKPAVEGILGKLYVFMGKYAEALPFLDASIADVQANKQTFLYDYNETLAPGGEFLPIDFIAGPNGPGRRSNDTKESVLFKIWDNIVFGGNITGNDGLVLTPETQALFGPNDLRLLFYTDLNPDLTTTNSAGRLRKNGVIYSRFGLQLPDLYLLRAECRARLNNLSGAVEDLEYLRTRRIRTTDMAGIPIYDALVPSSIAGNQDELIKFVIDERIREFAMEGYRWFDMRRLSLDPLFAGKAYTHTLFNMDGSTTTYTLNKPNRLVLQFPRNIMDRNPGMLNNP